MNNKACYIVNFYLGDRRKTVERYSHHDRLYFLKLQIETLEKYSHSLGKIIFSFNFREEDYKYVNRIFKIVPKYIQGAEVEVHFRENYGMSYGAWSDAFDRNQHRYDYFIFNEDDYFFTQNNWDTYLIDKFNSYPDSGFVCMMTREPHHWNDYKKHCGHAVAISSNNVLTHIKTKYGSLPHSDKQDYHSNERRGQIDQSFAAIELGYNIYDVRDDYKIPFAWTEDDGRDIWMFHPWNEKVLCTPALLMEDVGYSWFESWDGEFVESFTPTSQQEAYRQYTEKETYFGEKESTENS